MPKVDNGRKTAHLPQEPAELRRLESVRIRAFYPHRLERRRLRGEQPVHRELPRSTAGADDAKPISIFEF